MSTAAKLGIAAGILIGCAGLVIIAAGFASRQSDPAPVAAGLAVFAFGLVTISINLYVQARHLREQLPRESNSSGSDKRRSCDVCGKGAAVILCTMHKTSLCPACLAVHYESRGCVYVPVARRSGVRTVRGAAASRG